MGLVKAKYKKYKRIIALACAFIISFCIGGCGDVKEEAPELLEPASKITTMRPISYRNVARVESLMGVVVPEQSFVVSRKSALIKGFAVNIGDYVNKGDVVAYGDTTFYEREIAAKEDEKNAIVSELQSDNNIADEEIKQLEYKRDAAEQVGNAINVAAINTEIVILQENKRYNEEVKNADIDKLAKEINTLKSEKNDLTFTAPCSGTVTFIKDITAKPTASFNENIAVISDFENLYIEAPELNINKYKFKDYEEKYTYQNGKRIDISEYEYESPEVSYASTLKEYPCARFKLSDESENKKIKAGDNLILYFEKNKSKKVLAVGLDSINKDDVGTFVYVCREIDGRDDYELERRDIKTGVADDYYVEVTEGLSEGELVYYASESVVPVEYTGQTVKRGEYRESYKTDIITPLENDTVAVTAGAGGVVSDIYLSVNDEVKTGTAVCLIDNASGTARLTELRTLMASADTEHENAVKDFDKREKEVNDELSAYYNEEDPVASETDALEEYLYKDEQLKVELEIIAEERSKEAASYESQKKSLSNEYALLSKQGNGGYTSFSEADGKIGYIGVSKSDPVGSGDFIYSVVRPADNLYKVMVNKNALPDLNGVSASLGSKVSLEIDGKKYEIDCIGKNGYADKKYLFTKEDKQYLTHSEPYKSGNEEQFFIKTDEEISKAIAGAKSISCEFDSVCLDNVITVPAKAIYVETNKTDNKDKEKSGKNYYVWKLENGNIVKEYVKIVESMSDEKIVVYGIEEGDLILTE